MVLALKDGKDQYDTSLVEAALRDRAIGYSHKAVDIRVVNGEIVKTEYVKNYPPDPTAAIFWLKNRNRDRWKDKHGIDHNVDEEASHTSGITKIDKRADFATEAAGKTLAMLALLVWIDARQRA